MSLRRDPVSIVLAFVLLVNAPTVFASTQCVQDFKLLAVSRSPFRPVFWISEDVTGECFGSYLLQVVIEHPGYDLITTPLKDLPDWSALKEGIGHLVTEPPVKVEKERDGTWIIGESVGKVSAPARNPDFEESFNQHVHEGGSNGSTWNKEYGVDEISLPLIDGLDTELVVYYSGGLYVNYDISQVHYFQEAGYLVIFTHQAKRAVGMDSMHGFLILKATQKEDQQ